MATILSVQKIRKSFGGVKALNGVDLEIEEGLLTGIIGPNGSGKSTLFNVISGVIPCDAGRVIFDGKSIEDMNPSQIYAHGLARTFQTPRLFSMTVLENLLVPPKKQIGERIRFAPLNRKWSDQEAGFGKDAREVLNSLEISKVSMNEAKNVSGGQAKLLEIGRALMSSSKLVLLDEPTAGVSPPLAEDILRAILRLKNQKRMSFVIIEHRLDILFKYVDTLIVMHAGEVIAKGRPEEILQNRTVKDIYLGG